MFRRLSPCNFRGQGSDKKWIRGCLVVYEADLISNVNKDLYITHATSRDFDKNRLNSKLRLS